MYFQGVRAAFPTETGDARGRLWRADDRVRFIDQVSGDLTLNANTCRVAVALSRYVNSRTRLCWPTQRMLAELVGLTERSVRSALEALAKTGHLQVIQIVDKRYRDRRRNGYRIILKDDTGSQLPINGGSNFPVNTGSQLPVEQIEDNKLESNHSSSSAKSPSSARRLQAKVKAQGDLSCFQREEGAFEGSKTQKVEGLSSELRSRLGLPERQRPMADQGELPPAVGSQATSSFRSSQKGTKENATMGGSFPRFAGALARQCVNLLDSAIFIVKPLGSHAFGPTEERR